MESESIEPSIPPGPLRRRLKRALFKGLLFISVTVLVLNPNLKRAGLQVGHILHPESLIQTNFPGVFQVNAQIDRLVASDHGRRSEPKIVARYVLKKIRYVSDYENWGNLDYWPTAQEVWQRGCEDCDGRAVFAASVLRSRGFHSTSLVVGLDHMWITVDENEKDPSKPAHWVGLLGPNPDFSLELHPKSKMDDLLRLAQAFLHPTAFRDTSTHLFADIPSPRKALLIVVLLLLCYHPRRYSPLLLAIVALGLGAAELLSHWDPDTGPVYSGVAGALLLLLALAAALGTDRLRRRFLAG